MRLPLRPCLMNCFDLGVLKETFGERNHSWASADISKRFGKLENLSQSLQCINFIRWHRKLVSCTFANRNKVVHSA